MRHAHLTVCALFALLWSVSGCCVGGELKSGLEMVLAPEDTALGAATVEVMEARLDKANVRRVELTLLDDGRIRVRMGGNVEVDAVKGLLLRPGRLEFLRPETVLENRELTTLPTGARIFTEGSPPTTTFVVTEPAALDNSHVEKADVETDQFGVPYVKLTFDEAGRQRFAEVTAECVNEHLLIVIDGHLSSAPIVMEPITGGEARITMGSGSFDETEREAKQLCSVLNAGALPTPVVLESETVFGADE